ncbi:hypothetical protein ACJQWK_00582 [Exserohilum turcicum]|uniref:5'-3' DNA helicase ZGRF1-like N-terminal domain-containing protein n=1 Tax=Exserohilum turcicum (strain 28A) TaxID=671987 RepID=R0ICL2_EXST2|nr:uncharacterized protein SETTUDRAFT_164568 [Exserohilum turcica Et28A]EOA83095.1 hypothetical protein SETTUDRAFT_164568 [Exserohilum turcica Et28A]
MTAPLRNTPHASAIAAIAAEQTSAPVAEFRCLFTHDIRRKQKRWHDGFLKFHSFNSRVMVYDQARNFLGDTYYKDADELHEGDELNLNNGVLVEVSEPIGITHTDLTAVLSKKTRDQPPAPPASSATNPLRPFQCPSSVAPNKAQKPASQLRHKSLNALLGTPKGPIGKAQPIKSPYESLKEKEKENDLAEERAPKRQKTGPARADWRASSPIQEDHVGANNSPANVGKAVGARNAQQPKFIPPAAAIITIDSEPDLHPAILSDVTLPSTPPKVAEKRIESRTAKTPVTHTALPRQPSAQTPRIPRGKVPVPSVRALETPRQPAPPSSPPASACNRLRNIEFALQPAKAPPKEPSPVPPPARKAKCLRLSTGVKRGKLLCQSLSLQSAKVSDPRVAGTKVRSRAARVTTEEPASVIPQDNDASTTVERPARGKRRGLEANHDASKRARVSKSPFLPSPSLLEDPEVIHGLMDQQLLVPSSPVHPHLASSPPVEGHSVPKPTQNTTHGVIGANMPESVNDDAKPPSPKATARKATARNKAEKPKAGPKVSPATPIPDAAIPVSRDVTPALTEASDGQLRTSPPRNVPLSTDGLPKRSTKRTKPSASTSPQPGNAQRANKKGPLMSTTELAGLLQKPKKLAKALADAIEDDGTANDTGKSLARSFRRVRSENDAPIPSAAEAWEQRNLPKPANHTTDGVGEEEMVAVAAVAVEEANADMNAGSNKKKKKKGGGLDALIKRTDPRRKFKRRQSLQVDTAAGGPSGVEEVEVPSPVVDEDVGPWSTEAGDLMDWRPQGRG